MSINVDIFEVTGTSPGLSTSITNLNTKSSSLVTDSYVLYPIRRPISAGTSYSYQKYVYFKINSSVKIKNVQIQFVPDTVGATTNSLYYKFTNTYAAPNNSIDSSTTLISSSVTTTLNPNLSITSPELATSRIITLQPNTDYYSNYIVIQNRVGYVASLSDVGNGQSYKFKVIFDSF